MICGWNRCWVSTYKASNYSVQNQTHQNILGKFYRNQLTHPSVAEKLSMVHRDCLDHTIPGTHEVMQVKYNMVSDNNRVFICKASAFRWQKIAKPREDWEIWHSKWFWRLLMEQRKWQKKFEFTMVPLWMIYVYCSQMLLFHEYSVPCYPVSNLCPNRCPRGIQPVSQWHSSYRFCCWKNWASIFNYVFEVVEGALVFKVIFVKNLAI